MWIVWTLASIYVIGMVPSFRLGVRRHYNYYEGWSTMSGTVGAAVGMGTLWAVCWPVMMPCLYGWALVTSLAEGSKLFRSDAAIEREREASLRERERAVREAERVIALWDRKHGSPEDSEPVKRDGYLGFYE